MYSTKKEEFCQLQINFDLCPNKSYNLLNNINFKYMKKIVNDQRGNSTTILVVVIVFLVIAGIYMFTKSPKTETPNLDDQAMTSGEAGEDTKDVAGETMEVPANDMEAVDEMEVKDDAMMKEEGDAMMKVEGDAMMEATK